MGKYTVYQINKGKYSVCESENFDTLNTAMGNCLEVKATGLDYQQAVNLKKKLDNERN